MIKFWISPVSIEIIDIVADICNKRNNNIIGFIISKNQVWDDGYTGFNNKTLIDYIRSKFKYSPPIFRDHSNCSTFNLEIDCQQLNGIHIDPFNGEGDNPIERTRNTILYCESINAELQYEIGTEEGKFPYNYYYLDDYLKYLKLTLSEKVFDKIKFAVVQTGSVLHNGKNIKSPDYGAARAFHEVCKKYGKIAKVHNFDYVSNDIIKKQVEIFNNNLAVNICPEIAFVQSSTIYDNADEEVKKEIYNLCLNSPQRKRWFDDNFEFNEKKRIVVGNLLHYFYKQKEIELLNRKFKPEIELNLRSWFEFKIKAIYGLMS